MHVWYARMEYVIFDLNNNFIIKGAIYKSVFNYIIWHLSRYICYNKHKLFNL